MIAKGFLIVAGSGEMRVVKKRPHLALNEVAFPITAKIPDVWARIQTATIDITVPDPPEGVVLIDDPELSDVDGSLS